MQLNIYDLNIGNEYKIGNIQRLFTTESYSSVQLLITKIIKCSKNWKLKQGVCTDTVLIYISLLIISCIIEYVTNKRTLNLEP